MANIFLARPEALQIETRIEQIRLLDDGRPALILAENPFRPAGGGQPADHGHLVSGSRTYLVSEVHKADGATWVVASNGTFEPGQPVEVFVDAERRKLLSQGHTLTHLMMATIRETVPGYESKGADIADAGRAIELRFRSEAIVTENMIREIDRATRSRITRAIPVSVTRARSMDEAARSFEHWRVDPDLALGGKVRVVVIEGIDANPCSGSHVGSTAEIGPYAVTGHEARRLGLNLLRLEKLPAWTYWY